MSKRETSLWFGIYGKPYRGDEPAFFDESVLPFAELLKAAQPSLKASIEPLISQGGDDFKPYFEETLQLPAKHWCMIGFRAWGKDDPKNLARFPEVARLLEQLPDLVSVSLSLLKPHARILPHVGETNAVFRVHLGIKVPNDKDNCTFTVKGESRAWQEGELLTFVDASLHEAANNTDEARCVLLLDVMRPEFAHLRRQVCVLSLSRLSLYYLLALVPGLPLAKLQANLAAIPDVLITSLLLPFRLIWNLLWWSRRWGMNQLPGKGESR